MEDGRREIRILNFAVSIASKNKNIEIEEFREFRILKRFFWRSWGVRVTRTASDVFCLKHKVIEK